MAFVTLLTYPVHSALCLKRTVFIFSAYIPFPATFTTKHQLGISAVCILSLSDIFTSAVYAFALIVTVAFARELLP